MTSPFFQRGLLFAKILGATKSRWGGLVVLTVLAVLFLLLPRLGLLDEYVQFVIMLIGINVILTTSLNLVNGYMGEFSIGHAGFMAVGAYVSALLTVRVFPQGDFAGLFFPLAIILGALAAAVAGFFVGIVSFKTRGDYLAIVTLAFTMIIKSIIENIDAIGGPRGFLGMSPLTNTATVFAWTVLCVWLIRNLVYSRYGRGILSIREDETAASLCGVDTRRVKLIAFVISAAFAGVAGALFAHLLLVITPKTFDIIKSTDILIMVYLGGIGSLGGSVLGATIYTVLMEILRPLGVWRMVFIPLLLILLMLFRPRGIMGLKEFPWLEPKK